MKKLVLVGLIGLTALSAQANGHHGHRRHPVYPSRHYDWVVPAIVTGAVVYAATRPPVVQQPPVVVQPQVPYGYHYENILDANCSCYRTVLVPN